MKLAIPILLLCLTSLGQPAMPSTNRPAFKRPLQTPKASTIQTATVMRKGAAVSLPSLTVGGSTAVSIGYDIPVTYNTNDSYVQFMASADLTNWVFIGRMPNFPGDKWVFTETNHAPFNFYRAVTVAGDVVLTNLTAKNIIP